MLPRRLGTTDASLAGGSNLDHAAVKTYLKGQRTDQPATAAALAKLEVDWTALAGCDGAGTTTCGVLDGMMQLLGLVAADISGSCGASLGSTFVAYNARYSINQSNGSARTADRL